MKIVIDSCAWIELFKGSITGSKAKEILEDADVLYTPDVVLAEIARKYIREGVPEKTVNTRLDQISANSNVVCLDSKLAYESAKCYLQLAENTRKTKLNTPSLFDAIVLAATRTLNAKLLTGDQHFKSFPETIWV